MHYYQNYIIYKASGGLTHSLVGLWRAIKISAEKERFLIIDFMQNTAFGRDFSDFFVIKGLKYSDKYDFIPPEFSFNEKSIEEIQNENVTYENRVFSIFNCKINKNIDDRQVIQFVAGTNGIKGDVFIKGLRVIPEILEKLRNEPKIDRQFISVHFRNTNIKNNIKKKVNKVREIVRQTKIRWVYIASDDCNALDNFKRFLPHVNFIGNTNNSNDKWKQIYDCLKDIYFILQSEIFIPSFNSSLSRMINAMIESNENLFDLPTKTKSLFT